jgi:hypothetical protein
MKTPSAKLTPLCKKGNEDPAPNSPLAEGWSKTGVLKIMPSKSDVYYSLNCYVKNKNSNFMNHKSEKQAEQNTPSAKLTPFC